MKSILMLGWATALVAMVQSAARVQASYNFLNIVDTAGEFAGFAIGPAINNNGTVAFAGSRDNNTSGVFTSNGGPPAVIYTGNDVNVYAPASISINSSGTVAFLRRTSASDTRNREILVGSGGPLTTIATGRPTGPFIAFESSVAINDSGTVAFHAMLTGGGFGVFVGNGGPTTTIADDSGELNPFLGPDINNAGAVAFFASLDAGGDGIFASNGGQVVTIDSSTVPRHGAPTINDEGTVAFSARLASPPFNNGVFTGNGGPTELVGITPSILGTEAPAINDRGTVAYQIVNFENTGIFTGDDPLSDKVVRLGDPLFGSTLSQISFGREGLNDAGDIAFRYALANGVSGIAVARLIPEPSSLAFLGMASLVFAIVKRTRSWN